MEQLQSRGLDTNQFARLCAQTMQEVESKAVSSCECCSKDEWRFGAIFKPKAIRASSVPNQKQLESPDSPLRKIWLPVPFEDSDSVFRYFNFLIHSSACSILTSYYVG